MGRSGAIGISSETLGAFEPVNKKPASGNAGSGFGNPGKRLLQLVRPGLLHPRAGRDNNSSSGSGKGTHWPVPWKESTAILAWGQCLFSACDADQRAGSSVY